MKCFFDKKSRKPMAEIEIVGLYGKSRKIEALIDTVLMVS
jgi:hypothetical protein